jgi:CAAX protease family protein
MGDSRAVTVNSSARVACLVFALTFPSLMAWLYFVVLAKPVDRGEANLAVQVLYAAGKALQFSLPVLAVLAFERRWPRPALPHRRGLVIGLAIGLVVAAGILVLYFGVLRGTHYFHETPAKLRAKLQEFDLATPAGFLLLAVFISVVHSLFEEYYWRWYVFRGLERLLPLGWAVVVSALGFMAHHVIVLAVYFPGRFWGLALPFSLCIAGGGVIWAWLYHRSGSIYAPWLSHMIIDAAIMVVGYDLMFHVAA